MNFFIEVSTLSDENQLVHYQLRVDVDELRVEVSTLSDENELVHYQQRGSSIMMIKSGDDGNSFRKSIRNYYYYFFFHRLFLYIA